MKIYLLIIFLISKGQHILEGRVLHFSLPPASLVAIPIKKLSNLQIDIIMAFHKDLKEAISLIQIDSKILHDIVHGSANTTVATEGGQVKTVAKAIHDVEAQLAEHMTRVERAANDVRALHEQTQCAEASAKQARDQAFQTVGAVKTSSTDQRPGSLKDKLVAGLGLEARLRQSDNQEILEINVTPTLDTAAKLYLSAHFI